MWVNTNKLLDVDLDKYERKNSADKKKNDEGSHNISVTSDDFGDNTSLNSKSDNSPNKEPKICNLGRIIGCKTGIT